ncbi:hypothetical protein J3E68DRAFT_88245 [Trichoderma sp. SZMC 28012]
MIGLEKEDHRDCYVACINRCISTHAPKATKWSQWGGYRDFCEKLKQAVDLTKEHSVRYTLNSPIVIAAIAVKILQNVDTNGRDAITGLLLQYGFSPASRYDSINSRGTARVGMSFSIPCNNILLEEIVIVADTRRKWR